MPGKRTAALATVAACAALALTGCGATSSGSLGTVDEVVATDYVTLPPPTTTIPPTTTAPPEPGSIITAEATYVVVAGDFPFQVAARFGVDFEEFVALNGWTIEDGLVPEWPEPGTTIRIPAGATVPGGPAVLVPVPTTTTTAPPTPGSSPTPVDPTASSEPAPPTTADGCGTYEIVAGDYPVLVAQKLGTTVAELDEANEDTEGYSAFYVGLEIARPC